MVCTKKRSTSTIHFGKLSNLSSLVKRSTTTKGISVTEGQRKAETFNETNAKEKGSTFESPDIKMPGRESTFFSCCWLLKYDSLTFFFFAGLKILMKRD